MPVTIFSTNSDTHYNITTGNGANFSLPRTSGDALPASNIRITKAELYMDQVRQFSNGRLLRVKQRTQNINLSATFTGDGNQDAHPMTVALYATPSLYAGYNTLEIRIQGETGTGSDNIINIRNTSIVRITVTWEYEYTVAGAPTALSVESTLSEGQVKLSGSGAKAGMANSITGYEIQYRDSADNSTWGSWVALQSVITTATSFSAQVSPPGTRGNYRQFRARTLGSAGSSYYSPWKTSTNTLRRNRAPIAPTSITLSPTLHQSGNITITMAGYSDPDSNFKHLKLERQIDSGSWTDIGITTTATKTDAPTLTAGQKVRYRAATVDNFDVASGWITSGYATKNSPPTAPTTFTAKAQDSATYPALIESKAVAIAWSGATDPDKNIKNYELQFRIDSGTWTALASPTGSSLSHSPALDRGQSIQYRIRTIDTLSQASGWVASGTLKKNSPPSQPTSLTAAGPNSTYPNVIETGTIKLTWPPSTDPDGNLSKYNLQYAVKASGGTYGSWVNLSDVTANSATITPPTMAAGSYIKFRVRAMDSTSITSDWRESNEIKRNTVPIAPASLTAAAQNDAAFPLVYESGTIKLTWPAGSAGDSTIDKYALEYRIDGGTWVSIGTTTAREHNHTPPTLTRGQTIQYQVRTIDKLGANSAWRASGTLRKNRVPVSPTVFTAKSPFTSDTNKYEGGNITLAWSGQSDPDGNYKQQEIQYRINNGTWTALGNYPGSSTTHAPSLTVLPRGSTIQYRTRSIDSMGIGATTWKESNTITRNQLPITPAIQYPGTGKTTYNNRPFFVLSISADPDNQTQTLYYTIDGGETINAGNVAAGTKHLRISELPAGSHTIVFYLQDVMGAKSGNTQRTLTVASNSYAHIIISGGLMVDEVNGYSAIADINELLTRVNTIRSYYGLGSIALPGTLGYFASWLPQMKALQSGLSNTVSISSAANPDWLKPDRNAPRADVINQIRNALSVL